MRDVERWKVTLFLFKFKEFAQNVFSFYPRQESLDTITRLGITTPQAKKEIFIKLKTISRKGAAVCFSFHTPHEALEYPYKRGRQGK